MNTFYLKKLLLLQVISYIAQNCVAGFLLNPFFTPLGTFEIFNSTILNSNPFFYYSNISIADFHRQIHLENVVVVSLSNKPRIKFCAIFLKII